VPSYGRERWEDKIGVTVWSEVGDYSFVFGMINSGGEEILGNGNTLVLSESLEILPYSLASFSLCHPYATLPPDLQKSETLSELLQHPKNSEVKEVVIIGLLSAI
jgi:hypothetical protein